MCSRYTRKVNSFPADRSISFRLPFSRLVQTAALALRHEAPPSGHPFAQAPGAKDHHPQRAHSPPLDAAPDAVEPLPSVRSREPTCTRSGSTAGTKRGRYMDTSGAKAEEFRGVLFCLYWALPGASARPASSVLQSEGSASCVPELLRNARKNIISAIPGSKNVFLSSVRSRPESEEQRQKELTARHTFTPTKPRGWMVSANPCNASICACMMHELRAARNDG